MLESGSLRLNQTRELVYHKFRNFGEILRAAKLLRKRLHKIRVGVYGRGESESVAVDWLYLVLACGL